jgi:vacuolar-type H+-ATPase subunit H
LAIEKVLEIKEAESEAQSIRAEATDGAKKLMEDARLEVLSIAQAAKDEADETYKQVIAKASSEAEIIFDRIILDAKRDCDMLASNASRNKEKAVSIIVERIVG